MTRGRRLLLGLLVVAAVGCAAEDGGRVTGVVTSVEGDLAVVSSFSVRSSDGTVRTFAPEPGLLFDGTSSVGHLRDHLRSGEPVTVEYRESSEGSLVAVAVGDG
jgi:hypothetical protein